MKPNSIRYWVFLIGLAAVMPWGCGKSNSPSSPASSAPAVPTYRFGYYFGPGTMNVPVGLAFSGDLLWVSNSGNDSLQTWTLTQSLLGTITSYGTPVTTIYYPGQVAVGPDSYVYMMDSFNKQVAVFSPTGIFETTFGSAQLGGDVGSGVAVNGNYAYLSNNASPAIYRYTIGGSGLAKTFTAPVTYGTTGTGTLQSVIYLALDSAGDLYAADQASQRVMIYNAGGVYQSAVTVSATAANGPVGLALDSQNNIYASMANEPDVRMFSSSGALLAVIGAGDVTNPDGLTFDPSGNLYVADSAPGANKVVVFLKN